jgi:Domain of unknown function (DUF5658)
MRTGDCRFTGVVMMLVCVLTIGAQNAEALPHELLQAVPLVTQAIRLSGTSLALPQPSELLDQSPARAMVMPPERPGRPSVLVPLYVSFTAFQALDAHSTLQAVNRGSIEANPIMAAATRSRGTLIAAKALTTVAVIAGSEALWRRRRAASIVAMIALNVGYAAVVAHNYRAASAGR